MLFITDRTWSEITLSPIPVHTCFQSDIDAVILDFSSSVQSVSSPFDSYGALFPLKVGDIADVTCSAGYRAEPAGAQVTMECVSRE